jgi:transcriptional regulator with XRE-family HTH domain
MIKNLSTYIKSRRQNIGLTQKQLAKLVGVTDVTVSRWESGQREPIWSDFVKLCEVLGMELEWFIGKENEDDDK